MTQKEKVKKEWKKSFFFFAVWCILLILALSASTYAWFTFNRYTNVTPMSGEVGTGGVDLLISNNKNGTFAETCKLVFTDTVDQLEPISTYDLDSFYQGTAQSGNITISYKNATQNAYTKLIHGFVYLKSEGQDADVCFLKSGLNFGDSVQAKASMRLGMKITTESGTKSYIFNLDSMGVSGATQKTTVAQSGMVVSSISGNGSPSYKKDPSESIGSYIAGGTDDSPERAQETLCTLTAEKVATVEYWLYVEGCDDNAFNDVQAKDVGLKLGFVGFKTSEAS